MCPNEVFLYAVFSQSNWGGAGQFARCRQSNVREAYVKECPGQNLQKKSRVKIMNKRKECTRNEIQSEELCSRSTH